MKKIFIFLASLAGLFSVKAQDQSLLNPNQSLLATNPSFAGSNGSVRDQFVYNYTSSNAPVSNVNFYNGFDAYIKPLHGGLAISGLLNDQAKGTFRASGINLIYAPSFELKKRGIKIIPSIQLSYLQREVDKTKLTFGSSFVMWSPEGTASSLKKRNFDASAGLLFNYKNLYVGGTVFHINQPDEGLLSASKLPVRYCLNASYNLPLNGKNLLNFSAVYNQQKIFNTIQLAVNAILYRHIVVGVGYLSNQTVYANAGYRNNFFSVTAGYCLMSSQLTNSATGVYQVSFGFRCHKKQVGQLPESFEKW